MPSNSLLFSLKTTNSFNKIYLHMHDKSCFDHCKRRTRPLKTINRCMPYHLFFMVDHHHAQQKLSTKAREIIHFITVIHQPLNKNCLQIHAKPLIFHRKPRTRPTRTINTCTPNHLFIHCKPLTGRRRFIDTCTPNHLFFHCISPTRSIRSMYTCAHIIYFLHCISPTRSLRTFYTCTPYLLFFTISRQLDQQQLSRPYLLNFQSKRLTRLTTTLYTCAPIHLSFHCYPPIWSIRVIYICTSNHLYFPYNPSIRSTTNIHTCMINHVFLSLFITNSLPQNYLHMHDK